MNQSDARGSRSAELNIYGRRLARQGDRTAMQCRRWNVRGRTLALGLCALALMASQAVAAGDPFLRRTATVRVAQDVGPAVVNITTEYTVTHSTPFRPGQGDPRMDRFFRDFFEPRTRRETVQSLGSGVIIDKDRHVLTNAHVISGASRISVSLSDGREFEASLVGADPNNDLAVLEIQSKEELPWVAPGTSRDLMVGEPVIAIGNPFGLSNSVTTGVISAIDRSLNVKDRIYHGFLQTDASINPGNSGGPLLNAEGSLIGINTAIYSGAQGIGFAVPIEIAKRVVSELLEHGEIQPVWMGLEFQDLDPALQEVMQLPKGVFGALVNDVHPDSPASRAKVRRGDIVLSVDGHSINGALGFFQTLETVIRQQTITLEIWRNGEKSKLPVVAEQIPGHVIDSYMSSLLGLEVTWQQAGHFEISKVARGSLAKKTGIEAGDLLLGINGRALRSREAMRRALLELRGHHRALLVVQRSGRRYHIAVPLG